MARSASGQPSASSARRLPFALGSSTIASTTTSQPFRSEASVVTRIRAGSPPSTLAASAWALSSAFQAEAPLRASSQTSPRAVALAARPHAIVPLPATAGEE